MQIKKNERLPDTRITQHEPGAFSSLRALRGPEMHQKWSHVERSAADRSKAHFSYAIARLTKLVRAYPPWLPK